jgi:hypothetical protein
VNAENEIANKYVRGDCMYYRDRHREEELRLSRIISSCSKKVGHDLQKRLIQENS